MGEMIQSEQSEQIEQREQREQIEKRVEELFDELVEFQRKKVLRTAREILPYLTEDDVLNPHDFPELMKNPIFNYEEGLASGLLAAQVAIRARVFRDPIGEVASDLPPGVANSSLQQLAL